MRRDRIHSRTVNSFRRSAGGFRIASLVRYAAAGLVIVICRLLFAADGSCPGIYVVPGAGRLSLLFLQDAGAMSLDRLWHRRLRPQSASAFSDQTARFMTGRQSCPELGISENTVKPPVSI
jgi:hypothetical protein